MLPVLSVSVALPPPAPSHRLLVADIGGTHARFAWANGQGELSAHCSSPVAQHADLASALAHCVPDANQAHAFCLGVAGQIDAQGNALSANLRWSVSAAALQRHLGVPTTVINDFQALALGCSGLGNDAGLLVHGPVQPTLPGNRLVIGPGTGLGCAIVLGAEGRQVMAGEAGQMALACSTARQAAVVEQLRHATRDGHVSVEQAVSGPGLLNLYRALCVLEGQAIVHQQPEAVSAAALAATDPLATEALTLFCQWLGGFAADMAMAVDAASLWLAGGIVPQLAGRLDTFGFNRAFTQRGVLAPWLVQRPVRVIAPGQLALSGAALALR